MDNVTHFTLKTAYGKYHITQTDKFYNAQLCSSSFTLGFIKEKRRACMDVSVTVPIVKDERYALFFKKTAHINWIEYADVCSLTHFHQIQGKFTKDMINVLLTYILNKHSSIEYFKFNDASTIDCESVSVSLPNLSIATCGKTWYEKYFNASLIDTDQERTYAKNLKKLVDADYVMPFKVFCDFLTIPLPIVEIIRPHYVVDGKTNYLTIFKNLKTETKLQFCKICENWLDKFMKHMLNNLNFLAEDWKIPRESVLAHSVKYDLEASSRNAIEATNATIGGCVERRRVKDGVLRHIFPSSEL